jgi:rhodanese-related sulfurtransferase
MKKILRVMLMIVFGLSSGAALAITPDKVPAKKRSSLGLYLTAAETFGLVKRERDKVLFIDVRSRAEVNFLGMPDVADANIPYMDLDRFYAWDKRNGAYRMEINPGFMTEIERRLAAKGLKGKDSRIVLMCRSGDRSAAAAGVLSKAGYTQVYSVVDGYEGDLATDGPYKGQRAVNGWRNHGLPWSYALDKKKLVVSQ